jgi:hypothetical protein
MKLSHSCCVYVLLLPVLALARVSDAQSRGPSATAGSRTARESVNVETGMAAARPSANPGSANPEHEAAQRLSEAQVLALDGKWDDARLAFIQAYAVHPTSVVLWDLALAEIKSDHFADAARHLQQYRKHPSAEQDKLSRLQNFLGRAYARIGRLRVEASPSAILYVDGTKTDWSTEDPVIVPPGEHNISLVHGDQKHDIGLDFDAGTERTIAQPDPATPVPPVDTAKPSTSASAGALIPDYRAKVTGEHSTARTVALVTGATLTIAAVVTGTVFAVKATRAENRATDLSAQLGPASCTLPSPACGDLANANRDLRDWRRISSVAFVAAGVLGVATAGTLLLWRSPTGSSATAHLGPASAWITGNF